MFYNFKTAEGILKHYFYRLENNYKKGVLSNNVELFYTGNVPKSKI